MSEKLPWFRVYSRVIDDEKLLLLSFQDRWHFIALLCLKCNGVIDEKDNELRDRKIAIKLGLSAAEIAETKRRLIEVNLIDSSWQPVSWGDLQYLSDSSKERTRKYRKRLKIVNKL